MYICYITKLFFSIIFGFLHRYEPKHLVRCNNGRIERKGYVDKDIMNTKIEGVDEKLSDEMNYMNYKGHEMKENMKTAVEETKDTTTQTISNVADKMKQKLSDSGEWISDKANQTKETMKEKFDDTRQFVREKAGKASDAARSYSSEKAKQAGAAIRSAAQRAKESTQLGMHQARKNFLKQTAKAAEAVRVHADSAARNGEAPPPPPYRNIFTRMRDFLWN